ncbi:MAG: hypothetical protein MRY83_00485 [Flavobacteriales bacterium]|nr:hypothetical protein [Flavobacteriales bacterium]
MKKTILFLLSTIILGACSKTQPKTLILSKSQVRISNESVVIHKPDSSILTYTTNDEGKLITDELSPGVHIITLPEKPCPSYTFIQTGRKEQEDFIWTYQGCCPEWSQTFEITENNRETLNIIFP